MWTTQWRHTNTNKAIRKSKWHISLANAAECKYEFVHTELVQVFYDIKWISSGAFKFVKKNKQFVKIDPGTQKHLLC